MPDLASFSRRGGRATEARPGVWPSAGAPGIGERRRAAAAGRPPARRGAGDAGERRRWPERGRFKRGVLPPVGAVRLKNRRFNRR